MSGKIQKIKEFAKKEIVLTVAVVLAMVSVFFVHPDKEYMGYIDWDTLILLFCLMAVMAGFQKMGVFQKIGTALIDKVNTSRQLVGILVFLPFFFSMLITNDVALITFVPFAIVVLRMAKQEKQLVITVVLQTLAANLGSILTPIGNPQNLYLYAQSGMQLGEFIKLMLPYTVISGICLFLVMYLVKKETLGSLVDKDFEKENEIVLWKLIGYILVFILCLVCVAKMLKHLILFGIVIVFIMIVDRDIFKKVDYSLLGTFAGFFVFIGNVGRIPAFCSFLESILAGHEKNVAVMASQMISNVPAALLLSGFSSQWDNLIIGTNLGGLGTLIASMASLISYKQITREYPQEKGKYFTLFTAANIVMLGILLVADCFIA